MNRGYVKVWRKIEDSGLIQLPNTLALFMHILLNATHKDRKIGTPTGVVELKRGQYVSGRIELSLRLKQTQQQIRTSLDRLEKLEIITIKTTNRYSIYTIENYGIYQDTSDASNQQITNKEPTDNQQITTKQELNNLNIKKDLIPYVEIVDQFNEKIKRLPSVKQITDKRKSAIKSIWLLNSNYQNLDFYKTFFDQINKCGFLFGENNKGWTASFDWIFNKNNFVKIIEGNYQSKNYSNNNNDRSGAMQAIFGKQIIEKDITNNATPF